MFDRDVERRRLIASEITRSGRFRGVPLEQPAPGPPPFCVLAVEPRDPEEARSFFARHGRGAARPVGLVALSPEASPAVGSFFAAGVDDVVWMPVRVYELVLRLSTWWARSAADREALARRSGVQGDRALVGVSPAMTQLHQTIRRVASNDATVLVLGETGTGKELVARTVHAESTRAGRPFVALNLSAVPSELVESELFGHVAGAFTGAKVTRPGRLEAAAGGTLFLDEIGDLPLHAQVKLLRVLQERTYERVGDDQPRHADFRLVCATHRDLDRLVDDGAFREDLYYRLNVVQLRLPPLRERGDDVVLLAQHFLDRTAARFGIDVRLGDAALDALRRHAWPGNVRELQHAIESAVALAQDGDALGAELVKPRRRRSTLTSIAGELLDGEHGLDDVLGQIDRTLIEMALSRCNGNQSRAAALLRIPRQTLQSRMRKHGIG